MQINLTVSFLTHFIHFNLLFIRKILWERDSLPGCRLASLLVCAWRLTKTKWHWTQQRQWMKKTFYSVARRFWRKMLSFQNIRKLYMNRFGIKRRFRIWIFFRKIFTPWGPRPGFLKDRFLRLGPLNEKISKIWLQIRIQHHRKPYVRYFVCQNYPLFIFPGQIPVP